MGAFHGRVLRAALPIAALGVLAAVEPGIADAAEAVQDGTLLARVEANEDRIAAHRRSTERGALAGDLRAAVALYGEASGTSDADKIQARIVKSVGKLCKAVREVNLRRTAIAALGEMGHEAGARYLKPFLKPVSGDEVSPLTLEAIQSAGRIGDDGLVAPLLLIVDKSKNYAVATRAVEALGGFGEASLKRKMQIVEALTKTIRRDIPAQPKRGRENQATGDYIPGNRGSAGTSRWSTLSVTIPRALGHLTGRRLTNVEDWIQLVRENRRRLDVLFVEE
jgi:hypothetical protein